MDPRRPKPSNEPLQGRIILELLDGPATKLEIIFSLNHQHSPEEVKFEIRRLHMIGILTSIGISSRSQKGARLYDRDLIWELSEHGRYHDTGLHSCRHCIRRAKLAISFHPRLRL